MTALKIHEVVEETFPEFLPSSFQERREKWGKDRVVYIHIIRDPGLQEIYPYAFVSTLWSVDANHGSTKLTLHASKIRIDLVERVAFVGAIIVFQSIAEP
jgi:hypothetical protein